MIRISALILLVSGLLQAQAPSERTRAGTLWSAVDRFSTRYPDQVDSDETSREDPLWVLDVLLKAEAKPEAWRQIRKLSTQALAEAGLVPVPTPELERLPHNGRRSISNYLNLDGYHAAFHPKDAATFSALLGDVELLGDREVGRLGYAIQDCLFTLEGATFDFTVKGCWVKLQLRVLLQGRIISADGEKRNGTLGLLDPKDYASRKLAARLRECIDVALRHETPGQ